jgi:hypothetical protein
MYAETGHGVVQLKKGSPHEQVVRKKEKVMECYPIGYIAFWSWSVQAVCLFMVFRMVDAISGTDVDAVKTFLWRIDINMGIIPVACRR